MRYVMARLEKEQEDMIYRIYVTDTLRSLTYNTSHSDKEYVMDKRWFEIAHANLIPQDNRTPEEIIEHMRKKLGE